MSRMVYKQPLTHKNRKYMSKLCAGFRQFGEVNCSYPRQVVHCDVEILAGVPFMAVNDISLWPSRHQVTHTYSYKPDQKPASTNTIRHTQAYTLCALSVKTTIWPGEYLEVSLPETNELDELVVIEPHLDSTATKNNAMPWPSPIITRRVGNKVQLPNHWEHPVILSKNEHFGQALNATITDTKAPYLTTPNSEEGPVQRDQTGYHNVSVDHDNMFTAAVKHEFSHTHEKYAEVFQADIPGYNGSSGPIESVVNMGPVQPPQRKGRVPQYSCDKMILLQEKFDELQSKDVFKRPEEVGVNVEYVNPSILIKKPNGGHRLVTAFADVGRYAKPQPSLMPDVDSTLRNIARWSYLITSDLTSAFYQIPLNKASMKYFGFTTPFKGTLVYSRSAMGMPGSETALEELMCHILGDLIQEGYVAKIADDLYVEGDSPSELLDNWRKVLAALVKNNIRLAPHKTQIAPKSTVILGWTWRQGFRQASPHRLSTLSVAAIPSKIKGIRSLLGAYKVLGRVIPGCAAILAKLEEAAAEKPSQDTVIWTDELHEAFHAAQKSLSSHQTIIQPNPQISYGLRI